MYDWVRLIRGLRRAWDPKSIPVTYVAECPRRVYIEVKEGIDVRHYWRMDVGSRIHRDIRECYEGELRDCEFEKEVEVGDGDLTVVGRADVVCYDRANDVYHVVEFKTTSNLSISPGNIPPKWIRQVRYYCSMLSEILGVEHDRILGEIVVIRSDGSVFTTTFRSSPCLDEMFRRARVLSACIEKNFMPPPQSREDCRFCIYARRCWSSEITDFVDESKSAEKNFVTDRLRTRSSSISLG